MSAPTATAARAARRRPSGSTLLITGGLVVAVLTAIVLAGQDSGRTADLDPDNPGPDGAQALARVLADQGVEVTVVRSADDLDATTVDDDTTVVVTSSELLGRSTTDRLLDHSARGRLVVVDPGPGTTDALGVHELPTGIAPDGPVASGCADPTYAGLAIEASRALAYPVDGGCFPTDDGALLVEPRPDVALLGAGRALSNDEVLSSDNAAIGLRLLGGSDRLVWYVPSLDDLVGDDGVSLSTLLPAWLRPGLLLVAIALLGLLGWRARRLGPLAIEPLPVAVKAIETTRSRGRLYRKAGDRAHAAVVLRTATRRRVADRLRLGSRPDPTTLVHDVARHTGRAVADVDALIGPRTEAPTTDHDLLTLAAELAALEEEVRRA